MRKDNNSPVPFSSYWGNHFWSPGYCVDTVGLDAEMVRKYVKYQEEKERREKQHRFKF